MWKLLEKLSEITQFSRFFPSSNSVFDLRSSSSTTVNSISLSTTLIFVFIHEAQSHAIRFKGDISNSLEWGKFLLDEDTKTKPIHAPSPSFVSRILNYSLVCSCCSARWKHKDEADSRALFRLSRIRIQYHNWFADIRAQVNLSLVEICMYSQVHVQVKHVLKQGNRGRRHQTWQKRWTPATRRRWFHESQRRCSSTMWWRRCRWGSSPGAEPTPWSPHWCPRWSCELRDIWSKWYFKP